MIQNVRTICLHLKCYRTKIVGTHTAGHTVYWGIECVNAHSMLAGCLAGVLGALTVILYFLETDHKGSEHG